MPLDRSVLTTLKEFTGMKATSVHHADVEGAAATTTEVQHKGAILAIILLAYFMILLVTSVLFTALPSLRDGLDLSPRGLSWVQNAFTLVFGGLLLLGARAGDLLGRRRVFIAGLVVFSLASLLIALAPTGWWIIAARGLQGVGAAIVAPTSLSLLTASFPEGRERVRAVALYSATAGIGASLGLVIGGALTEAVSWRAGFLVNVPLGIAMIALTPKYLPETKRARGQFDLPGAILATLGVGSFVYGIIESAERGWGSPIVLGAALAGIVLLGLLVLNERRAAQPIMPLRLFASRERSGAYVARFLYLGAMIGFFYFLTQYMQAALGFTPLQAGLGFLPMTIVNFAVALSIPRLSHRFSAVLLLATGIVLTLIGMVWLSRVDPTSSYLTGIALPMVAVGAGQGLAFAPLTSAGIAGAASSDAGAASGLVNTFHQVGTSVGLAVLVAVATPAGQGSADAAARTTAEASAALSAGSVLLALSLIVSITFVRPPRRDNSAPPDRAEIESQQALPARQLA